MSLVVTPKNCDSSVKKAIQQLSKKLEHVNYYNFDASSLIGTDTNQQLESVTVGTGLDYTRPNLTLSHLGIEALTDPGADKILFWDDSATACKWLGVGNSLAITDVTINTIQDIRTTASPTFAGLTATGVIQGATSLWYRAVHISGFSADPGASGATFTPCSANTLGGYGISDSSHELYFNESVTSMWDGSSDLSFRVTWEVNEAGAADGDVDLDLVCYYKGNHEIANKTQSLSESHTITGNKTQYTRHTTVFTIDWDAVDNIVEVGDKISFILTLDESIYARNIIVNTVMFRYKTVKMNPEV